MLLKVKKLIKNPSMLFSFFLEMFFCRALSDQKYLQIKFRIAMQKKLNLDHPKTFNEKLQWLKLYDRKPEYTTYVDKYKVREYIAEKLGEEYLIPLLGVWDDPEDIDFDALPEQFVLKCNHNSGLGMCICKDKSELDIAKVKKDLKKGLKQQYYWHGREWPYKDVQPRIIAEKYMEDESGELKDYKVMCFGGKAKVIQVHRGRFGNHTQDFYDSDWNLLEITQGIPMSGIKSEKPDFLDDMLRLSEKLSKDLKQIRIDWYFVNGQLFFGEMTFFDASGFDAFEPEEWDYKFGDWIKI